MCDHCTFKCKYSLTYKRIDRYEPCGCGKCSDLQRMVDMAKNRAGTALRVYEVPNIGADGREYEGEVLLSVAMRGIPTVDWIDDLYRRSVGVKGMLVGKKIGLGLQLFSTAVQS